MHIRSYGTTGPLVIVLHGGPAAVGEAAPIARGLSDSFRVLEPWQRGSGAKPLTVATHVKDLHELIRNCGEERPALVGESWGAMLALAYAAAHPSDAGHIVLVGCGTFDKASRERMHEIIIERTDPEMRRALAELDRLEIVRDERMMRKFAILEQIYSVDPLEPEAESDELPPFDSRAHMETWQDMLTLQERSVYPAAFAAITSPVLMLHGEEDPHPGEMIRKSLAPYVSSLEYRALKQCGHSPWRERAARSEFFELLKRWLPGQGEFSADGNESFSPNPSGSSSGGTGVC